MRRRQATVTPIQIRVEGDGHVVGGGQGCTLAKHTMGHGVEGPF
jgi:hypothetical protein